MKNQPNVLALATALVSLGLAGTAGAQLNLPGLTPQDPSILSCASINGQTVRCPLPTNTTAVFAQQTSTAACTQGSTYVIGRDAITVSNGCRAEFRLIEITELSGTALTAALRSQIVRDLSTRLRADYRLSFAPTVELRNDNEHFITSTEVGYSGEARAVVDQNAAAKTIAFDSVYGTRSHVFSNLTYRVVSGSSSGNGDAAIFTEILRAKFRAAMLGRLATEPHSHTPGFRITTDRQRTISSSETGYSGQGEIMLDGSHWQAIEFDSTYDRRTDGIRNLTYRLAGNGNNGNGNDNSAGNGEWRTGVSMDENNQDALAASLAAEVRRQKGGGNVQIVINSRYLESAAGSGVYRYRGKFGYSFNDASWVTRYFDAKMSLTQNKVQDLQISKSRAH